MGQSGAAPKPAGVRALEGCLINLFFGLLALIAGTALWGVMGIIAGRGDQTLSTFDAVVFPLCVLASFVALRLLAGAIRSWRRTSRVYPLLLTVIVIAAAALRAADVLGVW